MPYSYFIRWLKNLGKKYRYSMIHCEKVWACAHLLQFVRQLSLEQASGNNYLNVFCTHLRE